MEKIYKYPLAVQELQLIEIPIGSRVLSAQAQGDVPTIWAMHSQEEDKVNVEVRMVATGEEFEVEDWRFIDTVQIGSFVWHVFMRE